MVCAVIKFYTLMMALMCILSHASYISDLLNITIFIFVEHQNIRLDDICQHRPNAVINDIREDKGKVRFFANVGEIWHASIF